MKRNQKGQICIIVILLLLVICFPLTGNSQQKLPTKLKTSLNAFSFNGPLMRVEMNLDDLLEYCAVNQFDAVDITAYYFPGYPEVPSDEYLYHIDRMMMSLKRCGCFDGLGGLIVGGMTKMRDNEIPWGKNANEIIADVTKGYSFPVLYNFPAGHFKGNRALIFGKQVSLEINATTSKLIFD